MTEPMRGVIAMVVACTIWGMSGVYYKLLAHIPPVEVLAHRTIWSCVFFALVLVWQGRLRLLLDVFKSPRVMLVAGFAALMISTNWLVFITSIQIGKAMEASLGYYIFPLFSVVLGAVVYRERMSAAQAAAVALALIAVVILTIGLGVAPWISLILAGTFGLYGLIKKSMVQGPVVSVSAEVLILAPLALGVLWYAHPGGTGAFGDGWQDAALLAFSGVLTGFPLILFSMAARRVSMATLGLVQYLNPSLQFAVATFLFLEPFTRWHMIAFPIIWTALVIYTAAGWRQDRAARRAAKSAPTSGTDV
ncbi:EamA family transporter RarD [Roseovarius pelagicus]|uniref:EamA family transporter RarD n=1 Tax=Roseovarius pelagicus TaxID=2980108 RepID=A0ABY6DAJ5_9RHOB|nr:EamA family transporter RarD [Roseovarius pelagicus]UXX83123.1 EamA family transporter RarD [Roseovarius pelagicus]